MITRKQFIKMLANISQADLECPVIFKGNEKKIDAWYNNLKDVIREDLCDAIVKKIWDNEIKFPRPARIRHWAIHLDSTIITPELEARAEAKQKKLDEQHAAEAIKTNGCHPKDPFAQFYDQYPGLKKDTDRVIVGAKKCDVCGRSIYNKTCICFQRKELKAMKEAENGNS